MLKVLKDVTDDIPFLEISVSTGVNGQKKLKKTNKYINNFNSEFSFVIFATSKKNTNLIQLLNILIIFLIKL